MIEIVSPGIMASVQDLGRPGYRKLGVGVCGAMDARALKVGNILLDNDPAAAGIEFTLGGFALRFTQDTSFALTGADAGAELDGVPAPAWWVRRAKAGQVLRAGMAERGMRSYLTVENGIDIEPVMGSRATDLKSFFGGHEGRLLAAGDRLTAPSRTEARIGRLGFGLSAGKLDLLPPVGDLTVRFIPAAEWPQYSPSVQQEFVTAGWRLLPDSNRMGYRLSGPALLRETPIELLSHGIIPGTIQLPPAGQPVIQLNDANTCGGYPKLGVVIEADLSRLAQIRLGSTIHFQPVDRQVALDALAQEAAFLQGLSSRAELARRYSNRSRNDG